MEKVRLHTAYGMYKAPTQVPTLDGTGYGMLLKDLPHRHYPPQHRAQITYFT